MTVKTRVKLQAANPKDKAVLALMQEAFRRLEACDFGFVEAGPFATTKGQQIAAEWVATLTECEEDTMQARVRCDAVGDGVVGVAQHIDMTITAGFCVVFKAHWNVCNPHTQLLCVPWQHPTPCVCQPAHSLQPPTPHTVDG